MANPTCVRVLKVLLNTPLFFIGALLLVGGLLLQLESGFLSPEAITLLNKIQYDGVAVGYMTNTLSYIMMATGGVVCVVTIFGICGALKKIRCCIISFNPELATLSAVDDKNRQYAFLTILLVIAHGVIIGLWVNYRTHIDQWMEGQMLTQLANYKGPRETDDVSKGWNRLQIDARCCGVRNQFDNGGTNNDFDDVDSVWHATAGPAEKVPATCCKGVSTATVPSFVYSATCTRTPTNFYTEGCYTKMKRYTKIYSLLVFILLGVALVCQIICILLACVMSDHLKKRVRHSGQTVSSSTNGQPQPPPYIGIDAVLKKTNRR